MEVRGRFVRAASRPDREIGFGRYGTWKPGTPVWLRLLASFGVTLTIWGGGRVLAGGVAAGRVLLLMAGLISLGASVAAVVLLRRRADRAR